MPTSRRANPFAQLLAALTAALLISIPLPTIAAPDDDPAADKAMSTISPDAIRADMRFLADDALEGRGTATRGHEIAAKYMASRFEGMGLQPAGDNNTYFQSVPVRSLRTDVAKSSLAITRNGSSLSLTQHVDFLIEPDPVRAEVSADAPVVFTGFGVTAPDQHYDDYKSLDVKGKIVAVAQGAPNFQSSIKAHYSAAEVKAKIAADHGVVGIIFLDDPVAEAIYPFAKFVRDLTNPEFRWLDKDGHPNDYSPQIKAVAYLSIPATRQLLEGSGHSPDEIFKGAKDGKLSAFPLPITANIHVVTESKDLHSPNVVAKLEGSDPVLKGEYLVYTAHLDHLGIGEPVNGDAIYNGALDNASGCSQLLAMARAFKALPQAPRRTILFAFVAAEEQGLLGSRYFATHPTLPAGKIAADLNYDGGDIWGKTKDITYVGMEKSDLAQVVQKYAGAQGRTVKPDQFPDRGYYYRSDQFSFAKVGVPAIYFDTGTDFVGKPAGWGKEQVEKYEAEHYHQPSDELTPDWNFDGMIDDARLGFECGLAIAEQDAMPAWVPGDEFEATRKQAIADAQ
ncbi:MAG: M20/M25/M40 family metallo-hydrolase, partial [Acidobacteria bacterium]|nr:M20/M25/M40 family metallo-hydrolase [Acidobacteriota bacterium]